MKASDLFVSELEAEGVKFIFGIPGEENLDLLDSIRESNIRLILTRHEHWNPASSSPAYTSWIFRSTIPTTIAS